MQIIRSVGIKAIKKGQTGHKFSTCYTLEHISILTEQNLWELLLQADLTAKGPWRLSVTLSWKNSSWSTPLKYALLSPKTTPIYILIYYLCSLASCMTHLARPHSTG